LEAAHLARRLETQAGRHVQVVEAESAASNPERREKTNTNTCND
jgi:hypothetical protein